MHKIFIGALSIIWNTVPQVHNFGFVKDFMMETENSFIAAVVEACWSHIDAEFLKHFKNSQPTVFKR